MATELRDEFPLNIVAPALASLQPPRGDFEPGGEWTHRYALYTIGQRKGLGIAVGTPVYVIRIDPAENRIVVGPREDALTSTATVQDVTWIAGDPPAMPLRALTHIRYNHQVAPSTVAPRGSDTVEAAFDEPQFAVTPGQLAVFYDGETVLGAGWIK